MAWVSGERGVLCFYIPGRTDVAQCGTTAIR